MKPYTIILLRPDYMTDDFGHDTFTDHVEARDIDLAIKTAQLQACHADQNTVSKKDDYYPLAVFEGHHRNLAED